MSGFFPAHPVPIEGECLLDSKSISMTGPKYHLGFRPAVLAAVFSIVFTVASAFGFVLGLLTPTWDIVIPIGASFLLALTLVILMVSIHIAAPDNKKVWGQLGITFALLYVALDSLVCVVWLFVVEPHVVRGEIEKIAPLFFVPGSFLQLIDGAGYSYLCLAALLIAPVLNKNRLERWIRWVSIANAVLALPVFLFYVSNSIALGIWWSVTIPMFTVLLVMYFRQLGYRE